MSTTRNWIAVSESKYPWERDALEFVRAKFPVHEPYRAWANFEFIADDGTVNEVDLLLFTSQGFFLVEIKSNPGVLAGDAHKPSRYQATQHRRFSRWPWRRPTSGSVRFLPFTLQSGEYPGGNTRLSRPVFALA
jgi:hypothetical protein